MQTTIRNTIHSNATHGQHLDPKHTFLKRLDNNFCLYAKIAEK